MADVFPYSVCFRTRRLILANRAILLQHAVHYRLVLGNIVSWIHRRLAACIFCVFVTNLTLVGQLELRPMQTNEMGRFASCVMVSLL